MSAGGMSGSATRLVARVEFERDGYPRIREYRARLLSREEAEEYRVPSAFSGEYLRRVALERRTYGTGSFDDPDAVFDTGWEVLDFFRSLEELCFAGCGDSLWDEAEPCCPERDKALRLWRAILDARDRLDRKEARVEEIRRKAQEAYDQILRRERVLTKARRNEAPREVIDAARKEALEAWTPTLDRARQERDATARDVAQAESRYNHRGGGS